MDALDKPDDLGNDQGQTWTKIHVGRRVMSDDLEQKSDADRLRRTEGRTLPALRQVHPLEGAVPGAGRHDRRGADPPGRGGPGGPVHRDDRRMADPPPPAQGRQELRRGRDAGRGRSGSEEGRGVSGEIVAGGLGFKDWLLDETLALAGSYKGGIFQRLVAASYKLAPVSDPAALPAFQELARKMARQNDFLQARLPLHPVVAATTTPASSSFGARSTPRGRPGSGGPTCTSTPSRPAPRGTPRSRATRSSATTRTS